MARSMWTGVISFGLVTIPVKLHSATEGHNVPFHLLHEKCDSRIKEKRWCPECDEEVDWNDVVKGFEYSKGEYVELTDEDFDKLPLPSKQSIELASFVSLDEIDPIYFDSTYYVSIDGKGAQKAYKLLVQVMEDKGVAGVGSITLRTREKICAIRSVEGRLCVHTLLYEDQIKENDGEKPSRVSLSAQEKKMAESLVDALIDKFDPGKFKDKYQAALKKLIKAKLKGVEVKELEKPAPTETEDLMEALRASIEESKGTSKKGERAAPRSKKQGGTRRRKGAA